MMNHDTYVQRNYLKKKNFQPCPVWLNDLMNALDMRIRLESDLKASALMESENAIGECEIDEAKGRKWNRMSPLEMMSFEGFRSNGDVAIKYDEIETVEDDSEAFANGFQLIGEEKKI
ncbi:hypothetical protein L2E82_41803 [Cichorium intybus]|uniref:Uncharacterized protein n=1 Tax=Cichorium intybus TaxID=13427 RepID=A0ACB8ZL75_CICIN|nr:hypothetical protein L2E82_41803 [Cichorium intybus]